MSSAGDTPVLVLTDGSIAETRACTTLETLRLAVLDGSAGWVADLPALRDLRADITCASAFSALRFVGRFRGLRSPDLGDMLDPRCLTRIRVVAPRLRDPAFKTNSRRWDGLSPLGSLVDMRHPRYLSVRMHHEFEPDLAPLVSALLAPLARLPALRGLALLSNDASAAASKIIGTWAGSTGIFALFSFLYRIDQQRRARVHRSRSRTRIERVRKKKMAAPGRRCPEDWTREDLLAEARRRKLTGYSRWNKQRLCAELEREGPAQRISRGRPREPGPNRERLVRALLKLQEEDVAAIEAAVAHGAPLIEEYREAVAAGEEERRREEEERAEDLRARAEARRRSFWFTPYRELGAVRVDVPAVADLPIRVRYEAPMWRDLFGLRIEEYPKTGRSIRAGPDYFYIEPQNQARARKILRDLGFAEGKPK